MAIDSVLKRRSVMALSSGSVLPPPLSSIGAGSRATLGWTYAFTFNPPPVVTTVIIGRRRRYHSYTRWSNTRQA